MQHLAMSHWQLAAPVGIDRRALTSIFIFRLRRGCAMTSGRSPRLLSRLRLTRPFPHVSSTRDDHFFPRAALPEASAQNVVQA